MWTNAHRGNPAAIGVGLAELERLEVEVGAGESAPVSLELLNVEGLLRAVRARAARFRS
jgi:hypothetical protein